jgi:hypothetical protein
MDPTIIIFELAAAIFSIGCMFGYGTRSAISQYRRRYRRWWLRRGVHSDGRNDVHLTLCYPGLFTFGMRCSFSICLGIVLLPRIQIIPDASSKPEGGKIRHRGVVGRSQ